MVFEHDPTSVSLLRYPTEVINISQVTNVYLPLCCFSQGFVIMVTTATAPATLLIARKIDSLLDYRVCLCSWQYAISPTIILSVDEYVIDQPLAYSESENNCRWSAPAPAARLPTALIAASTQEGKEFIAPISGYPIKTRDYQAAY